MSNKDVAEKQEGGAVAEFDPTMFEDDQGIGSEGMGVDDVALPFLKALSRQDDVLDDLEDAKAGDILNTATMEVFKAAKVFALSLVSTSGVSSTGHHAEKAQAHLLRSMHPMMLGLRLSVTRRITASTL